jgi:hypothetical protein
MSADKRRKILVGFAGLSVVLLAVIGYVSPTFRDETATGAIVPVEKHREPQIARSDVVLGNEQVKQEQKIVYADALLDAAELRSISAEALQLKRAQGKSSSIDNKNTIDNVNRRLDRHRANVEARWSMAMAEALAAVSALGKQSRLASVEAETSALQAMMAGKSRLDNEEMASLNLRLRNVVSALESADASSLELARRDLMSAASALEQKGSDLEAVRSELEKASSELEAASALALRWRMGHLDVLAIESKAMENASELSLSNADDFSASLGKASDELEAAALDNMKRFAESHSAFEAGLNAMAANLEKMSQLAQKRAEMGSASLDNLRTSLEAASLNLKKYSAENRSRRDLELRTQLAVTSQYMDAARRDHRAALQNFDQYVAELKRLDSKRAELASAMP